MFGHVVRPVGRLSFICLKGLVGCMYVSLLVQLYGLFCQGHFLASLWVKDRDRESHVIRLKSRKLHILGLVEKKAFCNHFPSLI